jgi:glycosyltransferase involved in cell wall biosynthesis
VDLYLAVSEFVRAKHIVSGFSGDKITTKPNFAWPADRRQGAGDYFLFAGRLAPEKGVRVLVDAWRDVEMPLVVVGEGPERESLQGSAPRSVEFRGTVQPDAMQTLLAGARALVLPSVWYEGAPRSILEAYAAGVPVIASSAGALPESVEGGTSGLLVPPGDPQALADAVRQLSDDAECHRLGDGAWRLWNERYTPDRALKALEGAYRRARRLFEGRQRR